MDNNRAAIIKELVAIVAVVALLLIAAGFLVRNVVVAVRSLDGAQTTAAPTRDDLEKTLRDLAARLLPAAGPQSPPPAPAAPAAPAPPAGQAKQNKKGEITTVRFFAAGRDIPQPQARRYTDRFDRQAGNIYIEIAYKNNGHKIADASIPLEIRCLGPAGRTAAELTKTAQPKKEWATAVYATLLGAPAAAGWESGRYTVELYFDGEYIGHYKFTIE